MNQWIVDNKKDWKIKYVLHTGDITDDYDMETQWKNADTAMKIFDEKLSVRETEKLIKSLGKEKTAKPKKKELKNDFVYRDLEEKLKIVTGTKVMINRKTDKSGKIEIEYYNQEDLEKIIGFFK